MIFLQLFTNWGFIIFILFGITLVIRLFYILFFFTRLAFYKPKPKAMGRTSAVSVIICARDEATNLAKNLPSILAQKYNTTHEVIVVNDNSYDDTKYLLENIVKTNKLLNVVELTQEAMMIPGKKFPLSIGIKTAKYEVVLLTDADCAAASDNWINSMQNVYDDNTEIVLGYGAYAKKNGMLNKLVRWETFHSALQYLSYAIAGYTYMGVGRNLSYKKAIFYRHKGFSAHNNIPGGDDDLFINMAATPSNVKINVDAESFTISEPAKSFAAWRNQKARHYSTAAYYKPLHKLLLGLYAAAQFAYYPLLISACLLYNWQLPLVLFGIFSVVAGIIYTKALGKLGEKDLVPYFILLDIWMFFYYIIFAVYLVKKPKPTWK